MELQEWDVLIGEDLFRVKGKDHQESRFKGAELFRKRYKIPETVSTTTIAGLAKTRKSDIATLSTKDLVKSFGGTYKENKK